MEARASTSLRMTQFLELPLASSALTPETRATAYLAGQTPADRRAPRLSHLVQRSIRGLRPLWRRNHAASDRTRQYH